MFAQIESVPTTGMLSLRTKGSPDSSGCSFGMENEKGAKTLPLSDADFAIGKGG